MTEPNPYTPPTSPAIAEDRDGINELVRAWEKLRLIYNGIMILPGIGVLVLWITRQNLPIPAAILGGILVAVGANAAFFLGPLAELYVRTMFRRGETLGRGRILIFSAGLIVSGGVILASSMIPILWPAT